MRTSRLTSSTLLVTALVVLLVGCAGKKATKPDADAGATTTDTGATTTAPSADAAAGAGLESAAGAAENGVPGPQGELLSRRIVYFEFDRAEIRAADAPLVAAHAAFLAGNPGTRIRLEGHTDERGTREYNIGLGERRGQAVRRALALQGASEAQLATVSFGEERPVVAGEDEAAYSQNRRVEILYLN
jgi:peptidoglycan-associated lipoprotein